MELRAAVYAALKNNTRCAKEGLRLGVNGNLKVVNLEVFPCGRPPPGSAFSGGF